MKIKKRILSILLICCMVLTMLPTTALAEASVQYLDSDGSSKSCSSYTTVTKTTTEWSGGWYVVPKGDMSIGGPSSASRVKVTGNVHLILADGCNLTLYGGITVTSGSSLTIYGQSKPNVSNGTVSGNTGKLTAVSPYNQNDKFKTGTTAIGVAKTGSSLDDCNITINGGVIEAKGSGHYPGIQGENVTINGGYVKATVPTSPTGESPYPSGITGQTVTINGGYVDATGGSGGGGICYYSYAVYEGSTNVIYPGSVTINGGTVTATGGDSGAGIGGSGGFTGSVTINGGTVTAKGRDYGAGIGGTKDKGSTIIISGGTINATGGMNGAGIGGGSGGSGGTITISGGTVTANSGTTNISDGAGGSGAGIGGGKGGSGGTITISGGTVTANGFHKGAGIGGGYGSSDGTFATTGTGNAIIKANSITDQSGKTSWSGIIFEDSNGGVYGTQTLNKALTIDSSETLLIGNGATLNAGSYVTNNGAVCVGGTLNGTVSGNLYYPLTVTGGTATAANTKTIDGVTYVKQGDSVTLNPDTLQAGYKLEDWSVTSGGVTISNNSFTMPGNAVAVTANTTLMVKITQQPQGKNVTYGENVTLSVTAVNKDSNTTGITYQWYSNGAQLAGETSNTLSLTKPGAGTNRYYCAVAYGGCTMNSNTVTVTVGRATGSVSITGNLNKTYDGQSAVLAPAGYKVTGDGTVTVKYKVKGADDSTYIETAPTNAGDYTVKVTKAAGTNYTEAYATKDFTIEPVSLTMVGLMAEDRDYEAGNTKVNMTGGTLSGILSGDEGQVNAQIPAFGTIENDNAGNDKTVTCNITLTGDKAGNYILTPPTVTVDIWKVSSGVTTAPSAKTGLTYIGKEQELVNAGSTTTGTLQYSTSRNGTYSAAIPMGTDVKEYSIWYKVVGDANHTDSEPAEIKASINRFDITGKELTITLGTALTYTGAEQTQSIESVKVGDLVLAAGDYTVTGNTGTDAGTYTLTVTGQGSFEGSATKDFSIAKKSAISVADINKSYVYTAGSKDAVVSIDIAGYLPNNRGTTTYSLADNAAAYITDESVDSDGNLTYKVGTNGSIGDVTSLIVTANSLNYEAITVKVNIKIVDKYIVAEKEESKVAITGSNTLIYGEALSTLTLNTDVAKFVENGDSAKEVTGTLAWVNPDAVLTVGTTVATWKFTPDSSHVNTYQELTGEVAITVNKATPNVTAVPTVAVRTYNPNNRLTDDALVGGTVTGVDGNSLGGSWSWQTSGIIPTVNNSGYVAVFTPTDTANYNTVTRTITVTVNKAIPYIATAPTAAAITYGDTLSASALTGGTVQYSVRDATTIAGSFAWGDSSMKPSVSDSNIMGYWVVFTPSDVDNYNVAETYVTLTVNKADNAPNMPSATMNVANSCEKVSDVTLPTDWVWQDADKNTALTVDTPVTATAVYNGADKGNYENETISVTITRLTCDHAHTEVKNAKKATCKETGYTGDTYCKDCGSLLTSGTAIPLEDHQGGTATCTKKAVCTVCGQEYGALDANNHVHTEIRGAVAATCTAGGYTGDTYCKDCGVKTKTGTVTPALGHNYTGKVTTEPTTDKEGVRTYTCDRCKHSYTESIPKLPEEEHEHSYSVSVTKEATCTDTGERTYTCSCRDSYKETIPALGHHYVSSVTKQPTTSSEGVMTYTCDRCGHSYTRAIAKLQDSGNNNAVNSNPGNNQADIAPGDNNPTDSVSGDNGQADNSPTGNNSAGSEPTDNKQGEGNTPDTGKPYIKDQNGKEGWDVIKNEVDKTKNVDIVTVEMNGSAVVPGDVLDEIKGKDVTVVFDMGGGITWSVNGQSITGDKTGDIDFSVKIGTNTIPVDIIKNITGERKSRQISLAYDGEFGFTAVLSIKMEAGNAGLYANLFYFNEKTGEMEFICADEIAADGTAELTFTHASDYAIVIDKKPMVESTQADSTVSESQDSQTETAQTDAKVNSNAWNTWWIIAIGIIVIVIGVGVFFVVKKKEELE